LSNDVNLRNKVLVEDFETFSAVEFEKIMSDPNEKDFIFTDHVQILDYVKDLIRSVFNQVSYY